MDIRRLDASIIQNLILNDLLRYDANRDMAVFISQDKRTYQKRYCIDRTDGTNNWWIECESGKGIFIYAPDGTKANGKYDRIFISESAIDALSFFNIMRNNFTAEHPLWQWKQAFISTGGVSSAYQVNQISKLMDTATKVVCITDNDGPGDTQWNFIKQAFPTATRLIPNAKDFNKQLMDEYDDLVMTEEEEEEFERLNAPDTTIEKPNSDT